MKGRIELAAGRGFEYAVCDLQDWTHIWVLFWFHLNTGWRPKVRPPRSATKRGVFGTRSPYRPNPIGLSVLKLDSVDGLVLEVSDVDLIDGTPILDIKPYLPYADVVPDAAQGWLEQTPEIQDVGPSFVVEWTPEALTQLEWLRTRHVEDLKGPTEETLAAGPVPHAYRRIKRRGDHLTLALRDWRLDFRVDALLVTVFAVRSGYRDRVLREPNAVAKGPTPLEVHREFARRFPFAQPG